MSRWIITLIIFSAIFLVVEIYAFQAIRTLTKSRIIKWVWLLISLAVYANFLYVIFSTPRSAGQTVSFQFAAGLMLTFLIPKMVLLVVMFGEDVFRVFQKLFSVMSPGATKDFSGRREFVAKMALGLASIPFASILYGIWQGRYNYKVLKYQLTFEDLPDAFDGFKITQISDIHSGSFTNREKIEYGVNLINEQKSDVMLFTGDIVNNMATEMDSWIDVFKQLKAPFGKYSILGNHDYGDYVQWEKPEDKVSNFQAVKDIHPKIGFDLLLDEH